MELQALHPPTAHTETSKVIVTSSKWIGFIMIQ